MRIKITVFWPAIFAIIVATVLFCLPGEEFPQQDWLAIAHLDKWIHVGMLGGLVSVWCLPLIHRTGDRRERYRKYMWVAIALLLYGGLMEFVQWQFIPYRSFELGDLAADAAGCAAGLGFARWQDSLQRNDDREFKR
jgi:H+/Cl- antiporter ClcA